MLVLIPARGGSKRVVRKNIRVLAGKPLIVHTIETAAAAFGDADAAIWVSTDCAEIADVARQSTAQVPFIRPPVLATDKASSVDVALHAIDEYEQRFQASPDVLMLLQPTSPFRRVDHLQSAAALLAQDASLEAVVGVHRAHVPAGFAFHVNKGRLHSIAPAELHAASIYLPNGAVYAIRTHVLRAKQTFYPERTAALEMGTIESLDIDTEDDWQLAEALSLRD